MEHASCRRQRWSRWWLQPWRERYSVLGHLSQSLDWEYYGTVSVNRHLQVLRALQVLGHLWRGDPLGGRPSWLPTWGWMAELGPLADSGIWAWPEDWEDLACWRADLQRAVAALTPWERRLLAHWLEVGRTDPHDLGQHRALQELAQRLGLADEAEARDQLRRLSGRLRRLMEGQIPVSGSHTHETRDALRRSAAGEGLEP